MTRWQAALAFVACLAGWMPPAQARLVVTDTPNSAATKEGEQFAPDSIPIPRSMIDPPKAATQLVAAAPRRVSAQIQLGLQRLHGLQGPQDLKQAGQAFMLAYSRSDPQAPAAVALCTLMGCYGAPDRRSVALWIERTRPREPAKAKLLEWASAEQFADPQLRSRAASLLREAVALQDPVALNEQGLLQLTVGQRTLALKSFQMAAGRGSSAAARNFNLVSQQAGENSNSKLAAAEGSPFAPGQDLYLQAKRYHLGQDVPINDTQAVELYRRAANLGHQQAKRMLELCLSKLDARGSPDPVWMRLLAQRYLRPSLTEMQPIAIWLQKDISLLADWLPLQ
jgi:uncharacterized protein